MRKPLTMIVLTGVVILAGMVIWFVYPSSRIFYSSASGDFDGQRTHASTTLSGAMASSTATTTTPVFVVTHIKPPSSIKGVYYTSWAAGTPSFRKKLTDLFDGTILNAVVIDVKDYSGRISFEVSDPWLQEFGSVENRIPDMKEYIGSLHKKGIYVIGRIAVFQDPFIVKTMPAWAVHDARNGALWRDTGGAYWADPTVRDVWKYNAAIAREAYSIGFDEINFDYIRFPSDGSVSSIKYSVANPNKPEVLRELFSYLRSELITATSSVVPIPISIDMFGQTTSDTGDMGIGQVIENAMPYFDYIDPMVYPSHYINGFLGYEKPAKYPYEVVLYEMREAVRRSIAATSSPLLFRPWLQAFDYKAIYTPEMVRDEIRATYDVGLKSWIMWNAGSVYDKGTFMTDPLPTPVSLIKEVNVAIPQVPLIKNTDATTATSGFTTASGLITTSTTPTTTTSNIFVPSTTSKKSTVSTPSTP
jgi:hypothetical protein